jgi:hypothetical protein
VLLARLVLLREELRATAAKKAVADMLSSSKAPAETSSTSSSTEDIPSTSSGRNEAGRPDPSYRSAADGGFFSYQRANLPKQCAAFLKELLGVGDRTRRVALINKVRTWVLIVVQH